MKTITVYCGARAGNDPVFMDMAFELGRGLGALPVTVLFGASSTGLMGNLARGVQAGGVAKLKGYLPEYFLKGNNPDALGLDYVLTRDLSERKHLLMDHADAYIALPGGMGTFDEIFTTLEEALSPYIKRGDDTKFKPIYLLNHNGFFEGLRTQINHAVDSGFISKRAMDCLVFKDTTTELLDALRRRPTTIN